MKSLHNYRYVIMFMIVLMVAINYIDRGAISYASKPIIEEFGLNAKSWGEILGYFGYGYMFGALFGGTLADLKGPKFVWILFATLWSLFEAGMAFAGNVGALFFGGSALAGFAVFRVLFGFTEGPTFSTINKTMANWAAPWEKGFAAGLGVMGTPVGALLTAPVAVALLSWTNSWKTTFILLGAVGILWVLVWAKIFTDKPEDNPRVSQAELALIRSDKDLLRNETSLLESEQAKVPWYHFFKNGTLVANAIGYFAFQYVNFMILTWTPKYLQDTFHFNLSSLWYLGMIPWIGAVFTVAWGGKISDQLRRKTGNLKVARSWFAMVSLLLTAACFVIIPAVHSVTGVLLLMMIGNAFNFLPNSVYWAVVIDTEPAKAGTFGGITHFITNTATIVAPTLTGYLVADYGYASMFVATAIAAAMGMVAMVFVNPGKKHAEKTATAA